MGGQTILAFDTSAAHCAAALLLDGRLIVRVEPMDKGQAERLMPFLESLLKEADLGWHDLSAIGVGVGPGNFTGIRIAVAAARGLALGLGVPALGVNGFDVIARDATPPFAAEITAPRGQRYRQIFTSQGAEQPALLAAEVEPTDMAKGDLPAADIFVRRIAEITAARLPTHDPALRAAPLYVRGADAAPARDLPPRIIS